MHRTRRTRRYELPSTIAIEDEKFILFRRDGAPIGEIFRKLVQKLKP